MYVLFTPVYNVASLAFGQSFRPNECRPSQSRGPRFLCLDCLNETDVTLANMDAVNCYRTTTKQNKVQTLCLIQGIQYIMHGQQSSHCNIFVTLMMLLNACHWPSLLIAIDRPYCYRIGGALPAKSKYLAEGDVTTSCGILWNIITNSLMLGNKNPWLWLKSTDDNQLDDGGKCSTHFSVLRNFLGTIKKNTPQNVFAWRYNAKVVWSTTNNNGEAVGQCEFPVCLSQATACKKLRRSTKPYTRGYFWKIPNTYSYFPFPRNVMRTSPPATTSLASWQISCFSEYICHNFILPCFPVIL